MIELTGQSLSRRQKELNAKVNEAAANNIDFKKVKAEPEKTDIDRLYKIDLAVKYKNIDYAVEMLISGDPLYISRILKKASWLYDDEYSNVINTDYLHHNVFPFMSSKMKKKLMTTISVHLKDKDRVEDFYKYCKQTKMNEFAYKFLVHTSEPFKLKLIQTKAHCIFNNKEHKTFLKCFFGNSFELFEAYLQHIDGNRLNMLSRYSYFYSICDVRYLELLEKHASFNEYSYTKVKLGLRISKDIVTKHKRRILGNPNFYVNILNMCKLIRHSNLNDVKTYAVCLLPKEVNEFWNMNYYEEYKPILHAIPENDRFAFMKKAFTDNYHEEDFEMTKGFYTQYYYQLMTAAEKEAWALRHIDSKKEILGAGNDFIWYQFVSFDKAFVEIKKYIMSAIKLANRLELLKILVQSAKSQEELGKLFDYYHERHVNEKRNQTEHFLKTVVSTHRVFEFDGDCWEAFNKILYSIDVYAIDSHCNPDFKIISILYHLLHNMEMPDALTNYMESKISVYSIKQYLDILDDEKKLHVYTYISNFYLERIQKNATIEHVYFLLDFMAIYNKTRKDIPEAVTDFINRSSESFKHQQILQEDFIGENKKDVTENDLLRNLKLESKTVADKVLEVKTRMKHNWYFRLSRLVQKLKVYFPGEDVTQVYLKLFNDSLIEKDQCVNVVSSSVFGIFQLSDEKTIIDFMSKYAPSNPKIDYKNVTDNELRIREAICRFACYSRPPVPLSSILLYLKGDYVHYCLPMFHMYLANLPQPLCIKFVESILDSPVSIQKHGLRLAFKCFSPENLKKLVLNAWNNTKNVSLRSVIYKAFLEKTVKEQDNEMHETLKVLTLALQDNDDDEVFSLIISGKFAMPGYEGNFIEAVWMTIEKLRDSEQNINRKVAAIKLIDDQIHLVKKETVRKIVRDYLDYLFSKISSVQSADKLAPLHLAKFDLVAHYIIFLTSSEQDRSESLEMIKLILSKCFEGWNDAICEVYVRRRLFAEFIRHLNYVRFMPDPSGDLGRLIDTNSCENASVIFETILHELQAFLPLHEIYMDVWYLKINIIMRKVLKESRVRFENQHGLQFVEECIVEYGRQLGLLVKDFVQSNTYFSNFTGEIANAIAESSLNFSLHLGAVVDTGLNMSENNISVAIAQGLLQSEITQAYLLALQMFPTDQEFCNFNLYKSVYDAFQNVSDIEVKSCFYFKFGNK